MSLEIERAILEKACKEMIETILFCIPNAFRGTIYRIGRPPKLLAERITMGIIEGKEGKTISWDLPEESEYNPPGKPWRDYRDEPERPLEAMAWCVERQKSWTAQDPKNDARSVRLQVEGKLEDFHHMEPVLLRKSDLNVDMYSRVEYSKDYNGKFIWQKTDYVVVAVIKIYFQPNTISIGDHSTRVIKRLSRSLGTELLSYQIRQDTVNAIQKLARDRLNACDILADSLRNAITKAGLVFSIAKQEIGYIRDQWEQLLLKERGEKSEKIRSLEELNETLMAFNGECDELRDELIEAQKKFLKLSLPPEKGEQWVAMQIEERWRNFFEECPGSKIEQDKVWLIVERLKKSLRFGQDPEIIACYSKLPEEIRSEWVNLIYSNSDRFNASTMDRIIEILSHPGLNITSRERSIKTLTQLKALAETMSQLERNTNFLLRQVLDGGNKDMIKVATV